MRTASYLKGGDTGHGTQNAVTWAIFSRLEKEGHRSTSKAGFGVSRTAMLIAKVLKYSAVATSPTLSLRRQPSSKG